jgi:hypothetical protein
MSFRGEQIEAVKPLSQRQNDPYSQRPNFVLTKVTLYILSYLVQPD